jgi:NAD(P)-dependent dehydrogenase (short-subunit alcohol dehydrogenase family)
MAQALRFDGRVAIVTGAGRGIGRAHALELARRGARVVVSDLGGDLDGNDPSPAPADEVVAEIVAAGGEAAANHASVADPAGAASIVDTALTAFGQLDIVVNNAGINDPDPFTALSLERFHRLVAVHYFGTLHVLQAAWPHLVAAPDARVVNTCSEAMLSHSGMLSGYAAAKGSVLGLTRALACASAPDGILVNAIAPRAHTRSNYRTLPRIYGVDIAKVPEIMKSSPAELVSPVVAFLCHPSCMLNGEVLVAGTGDVQRIVFSQTVGINDTALTAETVAARLDEIMDPTGAALLGLRGPEVAGA